VRFVGGADLSGIQVGEPLSIQRIRYDSSIGDYWFPTGAVSRCVVDEPHPAKKNCIARCLATMTGPPQFVNLPKPSRHETEMPELSMSMTSVA